MTQDEIIEMAKKTQMPFYWRTGDITYLDKLEHFAKLVAAKKQEDIIQIIKETPFSNWFQADLIETIKARGEQA
jgi:enoyl reductase-like protein